MKNLLIASTLLAIIPSWTNAQALVDVDFSSGLENLVDFSNTHNPVINNTYGVDDADGNGVRFDGNTWLANDTAQSINGTEINFSVDGQYTGSGRGSGAGLIFGWTKATGESDAFNLGTSQVVTVGITNAGSNGLYILSVGGAINSHGTSGFSSTTTLTSNNWYRLSGTILFDGSTSTFTFNDIGLYDLGVTGLGTPNLLISGTNQSFTDATNWTTSTQGRVSVLANRDRGFQYTDNYFVEVVPEPSAFALLSGFFCLTWVMLRRRRA